MIQRVDPFCSNCVSPLPRHLASHAQVSMNSSTPSLEDRSTSGSTSSTNHLSPLLRARGPGRLWHTLAKLDELHLSIVCGSLQTPSSCAPQRVPSSATRRTHQDLLSPGPPATIRPVPTKPQSKRHPAVITLTVTNVSTRPYVHTCSPTMLECAVVFLVSCGGFGPSTAFPS